MQFARQQFSETLYVKKKFKKKLKIYLCFEVVNNLASLNKEINKLDRHLETCSSLEYFSRFSFFLVSLFTVT